ncbi:hypothetical protein LLG96_07080 [bacterium]|nr:hypothetical protein [bacterium]
MCVTGSFVIVCNSNGTNNEVYRYPKKGEGATAVLNSIELTSKKVTALSSYSAAYSDSFYISAIKINRGSVKLYKGISTQVEYSELKNCDAVQASEVTALACDGTNIIFAAKVGSNTKLYSFTEADTSLVLRQTWNSAEATAMTFFYTTLMTAVKSTSTGNTTIYRGPYTDPDSGSESLGATEILSLAGYRGTGDFCYSIKNVSSDGDKQMYFTDTSSNLLKDTLYYSRWWREY